MSGMQNSHSPGLHALPTWVSKLIDCAVTLLLWTYFTVGFIVIFAPFYVLAAILMSDRALAFQRLNHFFYRGFFLLCRLAMPRQKWEIDPALRAVRSSVVVGNHVSYIDPLLMISLFPQHTTIVKNRLFHIPIFGCMLRMSGYLPADSEGPLADYMVERLEHLPKCLEAGGNIFVFPEGTRSRDNTLGNLNPGAFKMARLYRAPVAVVRIENTNKLFTPGKFLFNTCLANNITVRLLAQIKPRYDSEEFSIRELMGQVRTLLEAPAKTDPSNDAITGSVSTHR